MLRDTVAELCEAKRLLKAAVEDIRYLINHAKRNGKACDRCKYGNEMYCYADDCSNDAKWQHEAEALALIGEDTNVPASKDGDTNVGHKSGGWISCKDKMPEDNTSVLFVYVSENGIKSVHYGYHQTSAEEFPGAFEEMMKTVKGLVFDGLCAAVYTQVSDIEEETNGLLTYDRKVRKA